MRNGDVKIIFFVVLRACKSIRALEFQCSLVEIHIALSTKQQQYRHEKAECLSWIWASERGIRRRRVRAILVLWLGKSFHILLHRDEFSPRRWKFSLTLWESETCVLWRIRFLPVLLCFLLLLRNIPAFSDMWWNLERFSLGFCLRNN